ncbi:MAG: L,D-transpeptidase family protein [Alphaproteobacteria bacterium]|nr:L,D-transpeptidase family protein [Alphaproteobacteria bacterium]
MNNTRLSRHLFVRSLSAKATRGWLDLGYARLPCALGRSGRRALKREGDGASPLGCFSILAVYYRADRDRRPKTALPVSALSLDDGWCDAPQDRNYNRPVHHPYCQRAERMWRDDGLYDFVAVLDYNIAPRRRNLGSAIFLHVAHPNLSPTEGCIALRKADVKRLLAAIRPGTKICI